MQAKFEGAKLLDERETDRGLLIRDVLSTRAPYATRRYTTRVYLAEKTPCAYSSTISRSFYAFYFDRRELRRFVRIDISANNRVDISQEYGEAG